MFGVAAQQGYWAEVIYIHLIYKKKVDRMGSKRRNNSLLDEKELGPDLKRHKLLGVVSPSSSPPASENPRLPGFNYGDDDEEEDYKFKQNGSRYDGDEGDGNDDEEDDEDHDDDANHVKRSRDVEVRKDCPYLDTVNRQVHGLFLICIFILHFCILKVMPICYCNEFVTFR